MKKRNKHNPGPALLAVTWGDPAGIGPETVLKAFTGLPAPLRKRMVAYGDPDHFKALADSLGLDVEIDASEAPAAGGNGLKVVRAARFPFNSARMGKVSARAGAAAVAAVDKALEDIMNGKCAAMITAPINKEAANKAGYRMAGHTEHLSARCGGAPVAMMLASDKLKVVVATTHVALKDVPARLDAKNLAALIRLVADSVRKYGLKAPRIAVCGLNPHSSDGGLFGDEEARIITPALRAARKAGVDVSGPHPADTMFTPMAREGYDIAIAMYHDQGLIPVKALSFGRTVNVTLGLPFLRVSVDHGAAFDIAGKDKADWRPMAHAVKTADRMLKGRF